MTTTIENGLYTVTIKDSFFKDHNCPDIASQKWVKLFIDYKMADYLHNPSGPAIISNKTGRLEFWVDGKPLTKEESEKLAHNYKFGQTLETIISGE